MSGESPLFRSCRNCSAPISEVFADLGMTPLANSFLNLDQLGSMEPFFPLQALVCDRCFLVQLSRHVDPGEIFSDYVYFSSWSSTWVAHAGAFAKRACADLGLGRTNKVVELASNDGYLLQHFVDMDIPVLGVEPAANVARAAIDRGIPTVVEFFGVALAQQLVSDHQADLLVGNNVLAHVPDLHDFVEGMKVLLAPNGCISVEIPHLLRLVQRHQFDTIYHEHVCYFSLHAVVELFGAHGLAVVDVEELSTHGGSLRIWAKHSDLSTDPSQRVEDVLGAERAAGFDDIESYRRFARSVAEEKLNILSVLIGLKREGNTIVGYGAPAKGNTLLNYCGIGTDLLDSTVDLSPHKQGLFLPGTHIPVFAPDHLRKVQPEYVLILPWNLEAEIVNSLAYIREWGGRFLVRRPELIVVP